MLNLANSGTLVLVSSGVLNCILHIPLYIISRTALYNTPAYGIANGFSKSIIFFMYAIVFRFGAYLVTQPTDSIAYVEFFDVFRVFIAIVFGGAAIGQASAFAPNLAKAKLSANRIFFMLDRVPLIDNYSEEGSKPVSLLKQQQSIC